MRERERKKNSSALPTSMYLPTFELQIKAILWPVYWYGDRLNDRIFRYQRFHVWPNSVYVDGALLASFNSCVKWNEMKSRNKYLAWIQSMSHNFILLYTIQSNLANTYANRFPTGNGSHLHRYLYVNLKYKNLNCSVCSSRARVAICLNE